MRERLILLEASAESLRRHGVDEHVIAEALAEAQGQEVSHPLPV